MNAFPKTLRLLLAGCLYLGTQAEAATSYYVSTAGSNSNPGTLTLPFRTIQTAINAATAGDVIYVRALTSGGAQMVYQERLICTNKNGTAAAPITLRNYPPDTNGDGTQAYPAVDQNGVPPPAGMTALLAITNCSYLTIQGLEFRNYQTADEAVTPAGIYISGSGTGVRLLGNKVHHIYQNNTVLNNANANGFGIIVYGNTAAAPVDQLIIDGNEVYSLRTGQSESLSLNGNVTNFQITNNTVHDCNNIGIDCIGFEQKKVDDSVDYARNGVIRGNLVYNVDSQYNPGYGGNFSGSFANQDARNATRSAPGIYVDGGANITVERNDVHDCNIGMSFSCETANRYTVGCLVRDNLIRRNHVGGLFLGGAGGSNGGTQNCSVRNNTFYQNDIENYGGGSLDIQHYVTGTTITQNLFVCAPVNTQFVVKDTKDGTFAANAINWNLYSGTATDNLEFLWNGTSYGTFADWKASTGQDASSRFLPSPATLFLVAAPANAADFALGLGSPALNVGDPGFTVPTGETDYFGLPRLAGSRVDIGMSERSTGPEINVEEPAGIPLQSGTSTATFGNVVVNQSGSRVFTISNTGSVDLTSLAITIDGTNSTEFTAAALSQVPPLAAGASATFSVTFSPLAAGTRTANLHIASNDADEPIFTIKLSGVAQTPPKITLQPLAKTVNPGATVTFSVIATGTSPLTYQWQKHGGDIPGAHGSSYTLSHVAKTDEDTYGVVVSNQVTSVPSEVVMLSVNVPVTFVTPPAAVSANEGSGASFSVVPGGTPPFTYQWRKNGVNIAGATGSILSFNKVKLTDAAVYSVLVGNIVGAMPSAGAALTVADPTVKIYMLPTGATAVLPTLFAGTISGYSWQKNMNSLPADSRYTGVSTKTLTLSGLKAASPDDSGTYTCTATVASGNLTNSATLIVYSSPPQITLPTTVPHTIVMPTGIVGGTYPSFQIPFNSDSLKTPTAFSATGLPAGLKVDPATGLVSGKPAVAIAADTEYAVSLIASNAKGRSMADAILLIKALPYGTAGTFVGPLVRDPILNKNLGGRFDLVVAATGVYTAKVTLGTVAYSAVGVLEADATGAAKPHGILTIKRQAPALPLTLSFDVDSANHAIINGDVTDLTHHAAFSCWRNKWGTAIPVAENYDLKTYLGHYTFGLHIPSSLDGDEATPQGMSYGSFTVATNGSLTASGRFADGTAFTCATFCGPVGQVLLYQTLYSNLGSILGNLDITQGTDSSFVPLYGDNTLSGTVNWLRPPTLTHVYPAGISGLDLTGIGGRYVPPTAGALLFGVSDDGVTPNAHVAFAEGGISGTAADPVATQKSPNVNVRIKAGGLVFVPAHSTTLVPDPNPRSTTLAITQSTGFFSGKATLVDTNPAIPSASITRTLNYTGMILADAGIMRGYGFFLLPRRPATPSQTVLTTDQLSGKVVLEKAP